MPSSSRPTPPPPSPLPASPSLNTGPPRAHPRLVRARQLQSLAAPPALVQTESSPAPAHFGSSGETLSDRSPNPPEIFPTAQSHPSRVTPSAIRLRLLNRRHEK